MIYQYVSTKHFHPVYDKNIICTWQDKEIFVLKMYSIAIWLVLSHSATIGICCAKKPKSSFWKLSSLSPSRKMRGHYWLITSAEVLRFTWILKVNTAANWKRLFQTFQSRLRFQMWSLCSKSSRFSNDLPWFVRPTWAISCPKSYTGDRRLLQPKIKFSTSDRFSWKDWLQIC